MSHIWIADIKDGQSVEGVYYLRDKSVGTIRSGRNEGKPYLMVTLSDRTGEREGRMWDNAEEFDGRVAPGDFVKARLKGRSWQGQMQLEVAFLEPVPAELVDAAVFLPVCPRDTGPYWDALCDLIAGLGDAPLRRLCQAALDDPEIGDGLRRAPAATGVHQAYVGGLLEHVCSMMLLADAVCRHYPALDRDLLLAGVLFHDMGKIRELSYRLSLDYTDEGKLIGHLAFGVEYIDRLSAAVETPPERVVQLKHLVLSHHGRPEYGTAKIPMFAEAAALHYLDNLDAKIFGFLQAEAEIAKGNWSERKWPLETAVFKVRAKPPGYSFALPEKRPAGKTKALKPEGGELPLFRK